MNKQYKTLIKNSSLKKKLLHRENIAPLEHLLNEESQQLKRLQRLKNEKKLDFGKTLSSEALNELFPTICLKVNEFLGIQEKSPPPSFRYYSFFKPAPLATPILFFYMYSSFDVIKNLFFFFKEQITKTSIHNLEMAMLLFSQATLAYSWFNDAGYFSPTREIILKKEKRTLLIPAIAHEYTHFLQHQEDCLSLRYSLFIEGHARGVENYIAQFYRDMEDNEAFLYRTLDIRVGELKSAYRWMCKSLGQKPNKNLLKIRTRRDHEEWLNKVMSGVPSPSALGNTLFSLYKLQYGNSIYKKLIKGDFFF